MNRNVTIQFLGGGVLSRQMSDEDLDRLEEELRDGGSSLITLPEVADRQRHNHESDQLSKRREFVRAAAIASVTVDSVEYVRRIRP